MGIYRIKPWEELTIRDDYMFKLIMSREPLSFSSARLTRLAWGDTSIPFEICA